MSRDQHQTRKSTVPDLCSEQKYDRLRLRRLSNGVGDEGNSKRQRCDRLNEGRSGEHYRGGKNMELIEHRVDRRSSHKDVISDQPRISRRENKKTALSISDPDSALKKLSTPLHEPAKGKNIGSSFVKPNKGKALEVPYDTSSRMETNDLNLDPIPFPENGADALLLLHKWKGKGLFNPSFCSESTSRARAQDLHSKLLKLWPQNPDVSGGSLREFQINSIWNEFFDCVDALASVGSNSTAYELEPIFESLNALRPFNFNLRLADLAFLYLKEERITLVQASLNNVGNMQPSTEEISTAEKSLSSLDDKIEKLKLDLNLLEGEKTQKKEELEEMIQNQEAYQQQESESRSWENEMEILNSFNIDNGKVNLPTN